MGGLPTKQWFSTTRRIAHKTMIFNHSTYKNRETVLQNTAIKQKNELTRHPKKSIKFCALQLRKEHKDDGIGTNKWPIWVWNTFLKDHHRRTLRKPFACTYNSSCSWQIWCKKLKVERKIFIERAMNYWKQLQKLLRLNCLKFRIFTVVR